MFFQSYISFDDFKVCALIDIFFHFEHLRYLTYSSVALQYRYIADCRIILRQSGEGYNGEYTEYHPK